MMNQEKKEQCKEQNDRKECTGKGWYLNKGKYHQRPEMAKHLSSKLGGRLQPSWLISGHSDTSTQSIQTDPPQITQSEPVSVQFIHSNVDMLDPSKTNFKKSVLVGVADHDRFDPKASQLKDSSRKSGENDAEDGNEAKRTIANIQDRINLELGLRVYFPDSKCYSLSHKHFSCHQ